MRGFVSIAVGGLLGGALACVPTGQFRCVDAADCSHRAAGMCEPDGWCSYPDPGCESERRYSEFAGERAGECVEPPSAATTTPDLPTSMDDGGSGSSTAGSSSSGDGDSTSDTGDPIPSGCDGVACSGAGTCVVVDEMATCACEPGLYAVGVECLEDPCAETTCFFVDESEGDDAAAGSRDAPWKTIDRLEDAIGDAAAGTHVLLRRGRTWAAQLDLSGVAGQLDAPIVVGAYGPLSEAAPRLFPGAVRIVNAEHVVVRDLAIHDDLTVPELPNRPCVMIERSSHVSVVGNDLRDCVNRGIRLHDGAAFTVIADNTIRGVRTNDPIFIADATWVDPIPYVDAHHWVIDNVVVGSDAAGIRVDLTGDSTTDVKVMGNAVSDTLGSGISVSADGYVWIGGNVIARAGDPVAATGVGIFANVAEHARVTGNVVIESRRGLEIGRRASVAANTVIGEDLTLDGVLLRDGAGVQAWRDNLVLAAPGAVTVRDIDTGGAGPDVTFEAHWYSADCSFATGGTVVDLVEWQAALMSDAGSVCGDGSGVTAPAAGLDPAAWDATFDDALTPDAAWERCGEEAGALACDGTRLGASVEPIDAYFEARGFGWDGPLLVKQRYPAPR